MENIQLLLASQSPRRKQLLQQIGINPVCKGVDIDESIVGEELPLNYCKRLALEKAQTGWQRSNKKLPVLGSDTIVVLGEEILGKPKDTQDAFAMLMKLSKQTHQVITAVAMVNASKQKVVESISHVRFDVLPEKDVWAYIATNEPMDKAGSYGIQGYASVWIKHISGSHSGIMGLPLYETAQLIKEFN
jgi:septum formation protein